MISISNILKLDKENGLKDELNKYPDLKYPGDDPSVAPEGTEWRGTGEPGNGRGSYYNPNTGESYHPDLNHPEGKEPHWDYNIRGKKYKGWRIYPDGSIELKF